MLANLIDFRRPVQQLFVRVIFLPGISDSGKSIRRLVLGLANRFADAAPVKDAPSQADKGSLICFIGRPLGDGLQ